MTLLQSILMGIIQGATEFLPVSSSGHLAIFKNIFHVNTDTGILFDILLHFGTLVAIFIVYWKDIKQLIIEGCMIIADCAVNIWYFITNKLGRGELRPYRKIVNSAYRKFVMLIIVSTITTMVIALPFEKLIGSAGETLLVPGICLCITSIILYISDRLPGGRKKATKATYRNAVFVGLAQGIATLPGISRSGSTITAGLACGFSRKFTVKYSFIMSIPAVIGAVVLEIPDLFEASITGTEVVNYIVGMVVAGVVGYLCIKFMLYTVKEKSFKGFSIYCLIAGIVSVVCYFAL
jgi:undecaprenyl-diphosphatase